MLEICSRCCRANLFKSWNNGVNASCIRIIGSTILRICSWKPAMTSFRLSSLTVPSPLAESWRGLGVLRQPLPDAPTPIPKPPLKFRPPAQGEARPFHPILKPLVFSMCAVDPGGRDCVVAGHRRCPEFERGCDAETLARIRRPSCAAFLLPAG